MIQNVLQDIGGVGVYGAISISLFFLVFALAVVRSACMKKSHADALSTLPLEDGAAVPARKGDSGHE
jgi:hypothetical protein